MIGAISLMRGIPWLNARLLSFMPEGKPVPKVERIWIALVLTLQLFLGFLAGIATQIGIVVGLFLYVLPALGLNFLHFAQHIAATNLPARLLFGT